MTGTPAAAATPPSAATRRRILIVDDHPIVRHGIAQLLSREPDLNCDLEADGATQALQLLHGETVDLVITDISMPGLSGLDLTRRIVASHPQLPVLVLSMHEESIYADRALAAGARGFITKQEATDRLLEAVRKLLQGGVWLSRSMEERLVRSFVGRPPSAPLPPASRAELQGLTEHEFEVLQMLSQGMSSADMAARINRSVKSIEAYRASLRSKLGARSTADLTRLAVEWFLTGS